MDKIFLYGLKADTLIGVYEWERKQPQTLLIDLDIGLPPRRADDDDIDYPTMNRSSARLRSGQAGCGARL